VFKINDKGLASNVLTMHESKDGRYLRMKRQYSFIRKNLIHLDQDIERHMKIKVSFSSLRRLRVSGVMVGCIQVR